MRNHDLKMQRALRLAQEALITGAGHHRNVAFEALNELMPVPPDSLLEDPQVDRLVNRGTFTLVFRGHKVEVLGRGERLTTCETSDTSDERARNLLGWFMAIGHFDEAATQRWAAGETLPSSKPCIDTSLWADLKVTE